MSRIKNVKTVKIKIIKDNWHLSAGEIVDAVYDKYEDNYIVFDDGGYLLRLGKEGSNFEVVSSFFVKNEQLASNTHT